VCSTIPLQLFIIPLFFIFKKLELTDNLAALSLIYCVIFTPFASFLLRTYFKEIDPAIHEAAAIDGAGTLQILSKILLPLISPGLLTVAIVIFLWTWNDFLMAVTFLREPSKLTVGIRFFAFQGRFSTNVGRQMAFAVMIMTPILVFFIAFQRRFIDGMTAGGVKG
ncbi:MAG: carbohydrate ABC transporter permease, partial [bacterium]|nr:carbohydrate ABC transporter permease [bacterium]